MMEAFRTGAKEKDHHDDFVGIRIELPKAKEGEDEQLFIFNTLTPGKGGEIATIDHKREYLYVPVRARVVATLDGTVYLIEHLGSMAQITSGKELITENNPDGSFSYHIEGFQGHAGLTFHNQKLPIGELFATLRFKSTSALSSGPRSHPGPSSSGQ